VDPVTQLGIAQSWVKVVYQIRPNNNNDFIDLKAPPMLKERRLTVGFVSGKRQTFVLPLIFKRHSV
jgi:hypothetical protein